MFMPFSHEALKAREEIEKDLQNDVTINAIVEVGVLNAYLTTKYFKFIKNNDEFDKIVNECLVKLGYKVIKIGTGNFIVNP
jgi:hypothetical protein